MCVAIRREIKQIPPLHNKHLVPRHGLADAQLSVGGQKGRPKDSHQPYRVFSPQEYTLPHLHKRDRQTSRPRKLNQL